MSPDVKPAGGAIGDPTATSVGAVFRPPEAQTEPILDPASSSAFMAAAADEPPTVNQYDIMEDHPVRSKLATDKAVFVAVSRSA